MCKIYIYTQKIHISTYVYVHIYTYINIRPLIKCISYYRSKSATTIDTQKFFYYYSEMKTPIIEPWSSHSFPR